MLECYITTVDEHLRKVILRNQREMGGYPSSYWPKETTGMEPASVLFRRELRFPRNLLFGTPPHNEQPMTEQITPIIMPVNI
jgi:hypothetical protein